jgi:ATP-dependent Clp protease ATP-binding subunit ClpX
MPAPLKPSEIVQRLNEHVIGQGGSQAHTGVAVHAHFRRMTANAAEGFRRN